MAYWFGCLILNYLIELKYLLLNGASTLFKSLNLIFLLKVYKKINLISMF